MAKKKKKPTPPPAPVRRRPERETSERPAAPNRKAAQKQAARRDDLRRKLITAGLVLAALAAVGAYLVVERRQDAELREALTSGSCEVDTDTDPTAPAGQNHVPSPAYSVNPPAGGDHLASAARGGVYRGTAVPTDGLLVHSLEHGYVVAWHAPDLPQEDLDALADFEREHDGDVIVAERAGMRVPVAATAWGQRLLCGELEPAALERFFDEHVGNGPEDVPRG